jgi:type I restriction enzyme M protein
MAMVEKVGHDKRGNTLFRRDEFGNEILISEDVTDDNGNHTTSKVKLIDDQTTYIPELFNKFKIKEGITW